MWTRERCVATVEPADVATSGSCCCRCCRRWCNELDSRRVPERRVARSTRLTGCWQTLADSQRARRARHAAPCLLLPRQNTLAGHKECGISKTCFRATQGESVGVSLVLLVTYARFLILPTSRHSPSASLPCVCCQQVCSLIYLLPVRKCVL